MAVASFQTLPSSKPGMWNLGDSPGQYPSPQSEIHPGNMAYQYPPPVSALDPPMTMVSTYQPYPQLQHPPAPSPSPTASKHHTNTLISKSAKIKRSMSTPNVRAQAAADALSAEKRRNKLGYHRTSIACVHCRRRKIRCILAPVDGQKRCANCIRLKKECVFSAVDPQPPENTRRGSKTHSGTGQASETSSPTSSTHMQDLNPNHSYANLTTPSVQGTGGDDSSSHRTASLSPEMKGNPSWGFNLNSKFPNPDLGVPQGRTFDYNQNSAAWVSAEVPSPVSKSAADMQQGYWRPPVQESPVNPAFVPYGTGLQVPPQQQTWATQHPEQSPREEHSWSGVSQQRSASYSNLEGLGTQQPYATFSQSTGHQISDNNYTTKPRMIQTSIYPSPVPTALGGYSSAEPPSHHSAGPVPPSSYHNWQQPTPYGYQQTIPVGYGEEGNVAVNYGYGEPAPSMYPTPSHGR